MSTLIDIASAIAQDLSGQGYPASMTLTPSHELKNLDFCIDVVPSKESIEINTRTGNVIYYEVQIGIVRKCQSVREEAEKLIELTHNIAKKYLRHKVSGCVCMSADLSPIVSIEELRDVGVFQSVTTLKLTGYENA